MACDVKTAIIRGGGGVEMTKNVILPTKYSLRGALLQVVVPTFPWLLSHHSFGHIYIFTIFSLRTFFVFILYSLF